MSADGNWKITINTPMGARTMDVAITTSGDTFTGAVNSEMGSQEVTGKVDGDTLTWSTDITNPMPMKLEFTAKVDGDSAYLTIKGLRDLTLGILGAALLAFAGAHATGWFMLVGAIIPLGDTLIVLRHGGAKAVAFGIHFATAVLLLISASLLFAA